MGSWSTTAGARSICEKELFACVVYFEAGNQSEEGKLAVAFVAMNRLHDGKWGNTFKRTVYYKNAYSWVNERKSVKTNTKAWRDSLRVAREVEQLAKNKYLYAIADFTEGRLYFQDKRLKQRRWHQDRMVIGNHAFYHERGWAARTQSKGTYAMR